MSKLGKSHGLRHASGILTAGGMPTSEAALKVYKVTLSQFFDSAGRCDCDALRSHLEANPEDKADEGAALDYNRERALDVRASRMLKEQKLAVRDRQLIPESEVNRAAAVNVLGAKQKFYNNIDANTAVITMKLGLTPEQSAEVRKVLKDSTVSALKDLHRGEFGNPKCPHCAKPVNE